MSGHTPGPWKSDYQLPYAVKPRVHASDGTLVAEIGNAENDRQDTWEADARLISAAPDMLAILKDALAFLNERYRGEGNEGSTLAEARAVAARLAAVIKQAEGEP